MRRRCSSFVVRFAVAALGPVVAAFFALGLAALPASASTVLVKKIDVTIGADDRIVTATSIRVRLDSEADFDAWSPFGIALDEHIELESLEGGVDHPGGRTEKVSRKDLDTLSASPDWVTHGSAQVRSIRFPRAGAGAELWLDYRTVTKPYFPALAIDLGARGTIERLEVSVNSAAAPPLHWVIAAGEGLEAPLEPVLAEGGKRLTLQARWSRPKDEPFSPSDRPFHPTLLLSWAADESWAAVGGWWEGVMRGLPRDAAAVKKLATELAPPTLPARERLEKLLRFARSDVRYVAVEVGVGGYRSAAPDETLTRRWGDCKAKAVLLADLLRASGLDGYPVLIASDSRGRIETRIANPGEFNHMILAVPVAGVAKPGDPVADGLLFVDPTHPRATPEWLHADVQDQDALVIAPIGGGGARLVRTPIAADKERERLEVALDLAADGAAKGQAALEMTGEWAAYFLELQAGGDPLALERSARASVETRLPGFVVSELTFGEDKASPIPKILLRGKVEAANFASATETSVALSFAGSERTPPSSILENRRIPVVARPGVTERVFALTLPEGWKLPAAEETREASAVGTFLQRLSIPPDAPKPRTMVVERRTEITRRWIDATEFAELRKLSLAEHRASRRRVRLDRAP